MSTIKVHNLAQQVLMVCELQGQISDGFWENSSPHDHWQVVCNANVEVDPTNVGCDFFPRRNYNFANKELLEIVGDRMIFYVKAKTAFPHLDMENHWSWDVSDGALAEAYKDEKNKIKFEEIFGCSLDEIVARIALAPYTHKQLVKDLKALVKIVHR